MSTTTDEQLELDVFEPVVAPTYATDATTAEKFAAFHQTNPHVARALEALTAQWLTHNDRAAMGALFERLRWESGIRTTGGAYKLNNDFRAYYTRLLVGRHPEWADAFATRSSGADQAVS